MTWEGLTLSDWVNLPPKQAIDAFKAKGSNLMTRAEFDRLDDNLRRRAFTVAYLQHDWQLELVHDRLLKAIHDGESRRSVVKDLQRSFGNLKRSHLETVHSTNILGAYQNGRWKQMTTPSMLRARPMWQYSTVGDGRVRPAHREMDGKVYPADDPVWDTWYPPNGFRCRCTVLPLSSDDAREAGGVSEPPTVTPDKGFAGSPGQAVMPLPMEPKVLPKPPVQPKPRKGAPRVPKLPPLPAAKLPKPVAEFTTEEIDNLTMEQVEGWLGVDAFAVVTKDATIAQVQKLSKEWVSADEVGDLRLAIYHRTKDAPTGSERRTRLRAIHDALDTRPNERNLAHRISTGRKALDRATRTIYVKPKASVEQKWMAGAKSMPVRVRSDALGLYPTAVRESLSGMGYKLERISDSVMKRRSSGVNAIGLHEPLAVRISVVPRGISSETETLVHELAHAVDNMTGCGLRNLFDRLEHEYVSSYGSMAGKDYKPAEDVAESFMRVFAKTHHEVTGTVDETMPIRKRFIEEMTADDETFRWTAFQLQRIGNGYFGSPPLAADVEETAKALGLKRKEASDRFGRKAVSDRFSY